MIETANDNRLGPDIEKALRLADELDAQAAALGAELELARQTLGAEAVEGLSDSFAKASAGAEKFREAVTAAQAEWAAIQAATGRQSDREQVETDAGQS